MPETVFRLFEDGRPVGYGKIRHFLTDALHEAGGNAAYSKRPGERNRGLGKMILSLLIDEARNLGIDELWLTIRKENTPSIRIALSNGGYVASEADGRVYISIETGRGADH